MTGGVLLDDADDLTGRDDVTGPDQGTDRQVRGAQTIGVRDRHDPPACDPLRQADKSRSCGQDLLSGPRGQVDAPVTGQPPLWGRIEAPCRACGPGKRPPPAGCLPMRPHWAPRDRRRRNRPHWLNRPNRPQRLRGPTRARRRRHGVLSPVRLGRRSACRRDGPGRPDRPGTRRPGRPHRRCVRGPGRQAPHSPRFPRRRGHVRLDGTCGGNGPDGTGWPGEGSGQQDQYEHVRDETHATTMRPEGSRRAAERRSGDSRRTISSRSPPWASRGRAWPVPRC